MRIIVVSTIMGLWTQKFVIIVTKDIEICSNEYFILRNKFKINLCKFLLLDHLI
jgi:hypothetical protein